MNTAVTKAAETAPGAGVPQHMQTGGEMAPLEYPTIARMFRERARTNGSNAMMRQKELGIWRTYSWQDIDELVQDVGAGLVSLGLQPGEVISILSNTCREWVWADLGSLTAGLVVNGIYPTDATGQVQYLCEDSQTRLLFVEDEEQLDKFLAVRAQLPKLNTVVVFNMKGLQLLDDAAVMSFESLLQRGRAYRKNTPGWLEERLSSRGPDDLAILVYTSGTTGKPKGAMLSHRNIVATCMLSYENMLEDVGEFSQRINFLPLCHVAERVGGEYGCIYASHVMNFVENPETIFENMQEVQPHIFFGVPRVWEKIYSTITIALKEGTALQRWFYERAIGIGKERGAILERWEEPGAWLRFRYGLARFLVLDNLRKMTGLNRCRIGVSGAAPISPELLRWYVALGIDIREAWGQTECTAAATLSPDRARPGSIGVPSGPTQVRVSENGELLIKGPTVFMGYLNQPEKTRETIIDGWLHTGDVGHQDADGYFYIVDRMKDIIITAGGKNITPSEWENHLKFSPYVTDAVVVGDQRAYLSCLIMIDHENVEQWAQDRQVEFSDYRSLCRSTEVQKLISEEVEKVNKHFARVEQIKHFRLIDTKLTAEDEELTPTMKLKRKLVNHKYRELIESMYRAQPA